MLCLVGGVGNRDARLGPACIVARTDDGARVWYMAVFCLLGVLQVRRWIGGLTQRDHGIKVDVVRR